MKRRSLRILLGVGVGLGLLVLGVWGLSHALTENVAPYHGKTPYYWSQQLRSQDPAVTNEANQVLQHEIIPQLTKIMFADTNDSAFGTALIKQLNELPGVQIFTRPAASRRASAAANLGDFGPAAAAAIPALVQAMNGGDAAVREPAEIALGKLHARPDEFIPRFIKQLDEESLRQGAAIALGQYGVAATSAVPKLQALYRLPDKELRHAVGDALRNIDPAALPWSRPPATNHAPAAP